MKARPWIIVGLLAVVALAMVGWRLSVGDQTSVDSAEIRAQILELRTNRVLGGLIVGGALAGAGVMLQCLMRNVLASPDLLGMSAGAGLAVVGSAYVAYVTTGLVTPVGLGTSSIPAAIGAITALGVVYGAAQRNGRIEPVTLVLVGVIVSIVTGSLMMLIASLMPDQGWATMRWTIGSLTDETDRRTLIVLGSVAAVCIATACWLGRAMDAAILADDEARSIGVPLAKLRVVLLVLSGTLAAIAVVLAGTIGFVGLIAPHIGRLLLGPAHRPLILGSALIGGSLIVGCDAISRSITLGSGRVPVGVMTALIGGPVFIVLLRRQFWVT